MDDNVTARMGARAIIAASAAFRLVGEATSGQEAIGIVQASQPDLVLMDVNMDGMSGAETTRRMLAQDPSIRIVAWTSSEDSEDLIEMIQAGCVGYTLKDLGPSELNKALLLALEGETPIPRQLLPDVVRRVKLAPPRTSTVQLTPREVEVLTGMAEGKLSKQIASELNISVKSVEAHSATIYQKLGVRNRSQAVAVAIQRDLVRTTNG